MILTAILIFSPLLLVVWVIVHEILVYRRDQREMRAGRMEAPTVLHDGRRAR